MTTSRSAGRGETNMKRSNLSVVIFGFGTALVLLGTQAEPVAQANPQGYEPADVATDLAAPLADEAAPPAPKVPENVHASAGAKISVTPAPVIEASGSCPTGMLEVEGDYCPYVEQKCLRWLDPETKMRCAEFAPSSKCTGKTTHKKFCIDRYEYPNKPGDKPVIMKTWYEARDTCQSVGKRLCGESEWTLACEGQEHLPYPYGYQRNSEACNIDKPHPDVNEKALADPRLRDAEVERLWQGEPSGTREACVSPFGVHDMAGNVDEWVVNESGHPFKSGLKGGYWGPVRTRCRPMTTAHNEEFSFYQIGFRCCSEQGASTPAGAGKTNDAAGAPPSINRAPAPAPAAPGSLTAT